MLHLSSHPVSAHLSAQSFTRHAITPDSAVSYLVQLLQFPSITPRSAGSIEWLSAHLERLGFTLERHDIHGVSNLLAIKKGANHLPSFAFCGHLDVVPAGDECAWQAPPFAGAIIDGQIIGRGAADMKGAIAAMLSACERFLAAHHEHGDLVWLITTDEEGEAEYGMQVLVQELKTRGITLDACLVGEPTSVHSVGDTIKNARRGALSGDISLVGKAGHVAYPEHTINAAHLAANVAQALSAIVWQKDQALGQTSLQVTNLSIEHPLDNIVPAKGSVQFNVRYSPAYCSTEIKAQIEKACASYVKHLTYSWQRPCEPYRTDEAQLSRPNSLYQALTHAIDAVTEQTAALSCSGGTSDGRFVASICQEVLEFGLLNRTIHQVNEQVTVHEVERLTEVYFQMLRRFY